MIVVVDSFSHGTGGHTRHEGMVVLLHSVCHIRVRAATGNTHMEAGKGKAHIRHRSKGSPQWQRASVSDKKNLY